MSVPEHLVESDAPDGLRSRLLHSDSYHTRVSLFVLFFSLVIRLRSFSNCSFGGTEKIYEVRVIVVEKQ